MSWTSVPYETQQDA